MAQPSLPIVFICSRIWIPWENIKQWHQQLPRHLNFRYLRQIKKLPLLWTHPLPWSIQGVWIKSSNTGSATVPWTLVHYHQSNRLRLLFQTRINNPYRHGTIPFLILLLQGILKQEHLICINYSLDMHVFEQPIISKSFAIMVAMKWKGIHLLNYMTIGNSYTCDDWNY